MICTESGEQSKGEKEGLTAVGVPRELRHHMRPRRRQLPLVVRAACEHGRVRHGGLHDNVLECVAAHLMEVEEPFEVHRSHLDRKGVGQLRGVVR